VNGLQKITCVKCGKPNTVVQVGNPIQPFTEGFRVGLVCEDKHMTYVSLEENVTRPYNVVLRIR